MTQQQLRRYVKMTYRAAGVIDPELWAKVGADKKSRQMAHMESVVRRIFNAGVKFAFEYPVTSNQET